LFYNSLLNTSECQLLIQYIENQVNKETIIDDFQFEIEEIQLVQLLGRTKVEYLKNIFGSFINKIKFRRVQERSKCINFHLDYAIKTLQINLNDDKKYIGGKLVYALNDQGFCSPERCAGFGSLHDNTVVHGVSTLTGGTRYGLFFLQTEIE